MYCVVLRIGASDCARDNLAAGNSDVRLQRTRCLRAKPIQRVVDIERGTRRAQRVGVMRARSTEQRHDGIADVLVDRAAVSEHDAVDERSVAADNVVQLFRIQRLGQRRKAAKIGKQNGDLSALIRLHVGHGRRRAGRRISQFGNGGEHALAVAKRMDPKLLQIRIGQARQHCAIDVVVGKCARVLLKP